MREINTALMGTGALYIICRYDLRLSGTVIFVLSGTLDDEEEEGLLNGTDFMDSIVQRSDATSVRFLPVHNQACALILDVHMLHDRATGH